MSDKSELTPPVSEELLECISGGVLTPEAKQMLDTVLPRLKRQGYSRAYVNNTFGNTQDPEKRSDVLAYIDEVWDSL